MNSIPLLQNSDRQLQRLAAQRQLYTDAKTIFAWQVVICGPLSVGIAYLGMLYPQLKSYAALWGFVVSLLDALWLTPWTKRLRTTAAQIQELFDCDVLDLPWEEVKSGKRPDPELIKEQSDRYKRWAHKLPPIINWYDTQVGELPLYIARIACQRANCWWDANQRRRYANVVLISILTLFIAALFFSIVRGFTLEMFVLGVCAPLSPAIILGFRQYMDQTEAASRLDNLKTHSERHWSDALSGEELGKVSAKSRILQNEIFDHRKKSPLLFDVVFKCLRNDYELRMNHGTSELAAEAQKKLSSLQSN